MPCKPRMAGCRASCLHRQLVDDYRAARAAAEAAQEAKDYGYTTERRLNGPIITFRDWLTGMAGRADQHAA